MVLVLGALVLGLAFANGANDVSKGIATLIGAGVADWRRASMWAVFWTTLGGLLSSLLGSELAATFSGKEVLSNGTVDGLFSLSVACGALGWLGIATSLGLPVSTTHAILGGLCGAGIAVQGIHGVLWGVVIRKAAIPLAVSPLLSITLVAVIFPALRPVLRRFGHYCVCLERQPLTLATSANTTAALSASILPVTVAAECKPQVLARCDVLDVMHWLSAGLTSLCRGVNDTPKIVAIGIVAASATGLPRNVQFVLVAAAMAFGSITAGLRVTRTLADKVTRIAPAEGFTANLVTSLVVASASGLALPVSTTQVSSSAIVGIGLYNNDVRWETVRDFLLAWVITLPVALGISLIAFEILNWAAAI